MENDNLRVHFVGIGGVSMSALALLCRRFGCVVSGSDRVDGGRFQDLRNAEIKVWVGDRIEELVDIDFAVYSSAISTDNVELIYCRDRVPTFERGVFLGELSRLFSKTVAIAGTHGKTTVTAILSHILKVADVNFVGHLGGETEYGNPIFGGECNDSRFFNRSRVLETLQKLVNRIAVDCPCRQPLFNGTFVSEACEYKGSFLSFTPDVGVVLNVENDHPDCYPTFGDLAYAFNRFICKSKTVIISPTDLLVCKNAHVTGFEVEDNTTPCEVAVFSKDRVDVYTFEHIREDFGKICVLKNNTKYAVVGVWDSLPHTPKNTLFVVAICDCLGISIDVVCRAIDSFGGVKRRNECVGRMDGAKVVFDYAHHPSQIADILDGYNGTVVFQPHTYSRTYCYFDGFVDALKRANRLILMPVYGAREEYVEGIDDKLYMALKDKTLVYRADKNAVVPLVRSFGEKDNLLFLGAGDIYGLKDEILQYCD